MTFILKRRKKSKFISCFLEIKEGEFTVVKVIDNKKFFKSRRFLDDVDNKYSNKEMFLFEITPYRFDRLLRYYEINYESSKTISNIIKKS